MNSKFSRIPSWAVAFAGAALVLPATAVGATWYQTLSSERAKLALGASSLRAGADQLWASHIQGDQRNTATSVFVALALSARDSEDPRAAEYAFGRAAGHLRGAVLSMRAASDLHAGGHFHRTSSRRRGTSSKETSPPTVSCQQLSTRCELNPQRRSTTFSDGRRPPRLVPRTYYK